MSKKKALKPGPVLIEMNDDADITPASAPIVPDDAPSGQAMRTLATFAARKPSKLARLFWASLLALVGFVASVAAWEFGTALIARNPTLGMIAAGLGALFTLSVLLIALREWLALGRLRRIDGLRVTAEAALGAGDLNAAQKVNGRLLALYAARPELKGGRSEIRARQSDIFDADAALGLAEAHLIAPLDAAARAEVETAARQVATVTAVVPLALADIAVALVANLRMIRRIAEIYGGRSGTLGSWRLTRAVFAHLVATGAVAVGDDLIGSVAGGGVVSKLSRRFGEGIINGALTARVGVAAMEVCRPLPFITEKRPSVTGLVRRALTGVFQTKGQPPK